MKYLVLVIIGVIIMGLGFKDLNNYLLEIILILVGAALLGSNIRQAKKYITNN